MVVMVGGGEVWTVGAEGEEEKEEESGMRIFKTRTHHRGVVGKNSENLQKEAL